MSSTTWSSQACVIGSGTTIDLPLLRHRSGGDCVFDRGGYELRANEGNEVTGARGDDHVSRRDRFDERGLELGPHVLQHLAFLLGVRLRRQEITMFGIVSDQPERRHASGIRGAE